MEQQSSKFSCIPIGLTQGHYNINSLKINDELVSSQVYSACIVAFIYIYLKNPLQWTPKTIDDIILLGAKFDQRHFIERTSIGYVDRIINVNNYVAKIKIEETSFLGRLATNELGTDLYTNLEQFFAYKEFGLFQCSSLYYLIWKRVDVYYVFDAQGRDNRCQMESNAFASLICTTMLNDVSKFIKYRSALRPDDYYAISGIEMKDFQENTKLCSRLRIQSIDNETYTVLNTEKAILRGKIHIGNLYFKTSRHRQAMTVGLMALVCNQIQPSNSWNRELVDEIILLGNKVFQECEKMVLGEMVLQDLPQEFLFKSCKCKIAYKPNSHIEFITKATKRNLLLTIKQAFRESTSFLVQVNTLILAVWQNDHFYYLFDPYARNEAGQIPQDKFGKPCVHMLKTVKSLYTAISDILTHVAENEKFVMHEVHVTLECLCGNTIHSSNLDKLDDLLIDLCSSQMDCYHDLDDINQNFCNLNELVGDDNSESYSEINELADMTKSKPQETDEILEETFKLPEKSDLAPEETETNSKENHTVSTKMHALSEETHAFTEETHVVTEETHIVTGETHEESHVTNEETHFINDDSEELQHDSTKSTSSTA